MKEAELFQIDVGQLIFRLSAIIIHRAPRAYNGF